MAETQASKQVAVINEFREHLHKMEPQFKLALPAHIPAERFSRAVMTAVGRNPKLLNCDWRSVFNACMSACQDGLLPDGREGVIVPFGEEDDDGGGKRSRSDMAQWLPMVYGIRKKIRNSGEIKELHAHAVYKGDQFQYQLGAEPSIFHVPSPHGRNNKDVTHVYSVARFNDGSLSFDVMSIQEVEDVRKQSSRAKKGPWSVGAFYQEMAIKTVVKHHAKSLPMSTDLDRLLHRDDALYDFRGAADQRTAVHTNPGPKSIEQMFDRFADDKPIEETQGKPIDQQAAEEAGVESTPETSESGPSEQAASESATTQEPKPDTLPVNMRPKTIPEYRTMALAIITHATDRDQIRTWFASDEQRKLRNSCGLVSEQTEEIRGWIEAKIKTMK